MQNEIQSQPAGWRLMQHCEGAFEPEKGKIKEIEVIIFLEVLGRVSDKTQTEKGEHYASSQHMKNHSKNYH